MDPQTSNVEPTVNKDQIQRAMLTLRLAASSHLPQDHTHAPKPLQGRSKSLLSNSTLAKYGVLPGRPSAKQAVLGEQPHFRKVLALHRQRKREELGIPEPQVPTVPYRPYSIEDFMDRLATFKLSTYRDRPAAIDAVSAARCGWINEGKDRLVCELCGSAWVMAGWAGLSKEAAQTLINRHQAALVESHAESCPWRTRQCDASLYKVPLSGRTDLAKDILERATSLAEVIEDNLDIAHPLSSEDVTSVMESLRSASKEPTLSFDGTSVSTVNHVNGVAAEYSEAAAILALFGWTVSADDALRALASQGGLSRAASFASLRDPVSGTPTWPGIPTTPLDSPSLYGAPSRPPPGVKGSSAAVIKCHTCLYKVGLWTFARRPDTNGMDVDESPRARRRSLARSRKLDVIKEHRTFCPYITRTTPASSFTIIMSPTARAVPPQFVEGWRAVLHILTRRSGPRTGSSNGASVVAGEQPFNPGDDVEAIVDYVAQHGGRELLRYVKQLLK